MPGPPHVVFQRLASWVAPVGVLPIGHDAGHIRRTGEDPGHAGAPAESDGPPPSAQTSLQQIVTGLAEEEWDVVVDAGTHTMVRPDRGEPVTLHDVVVHARRRHPGP